GQQPAERCGVHLVQDVGEGHYAGPAHSDIEYGGDPLRTVNPERLDQNPCDGDRPYNGEQDNSRLSLQDNQAYRSVTSGDKHGDHHRDRKSTRLNYSHVSISYAVFGLKKKMIIIIQ